MTDYYALLGILENATETEIRTAMRARTPEAQQDPERFAALLEAFETLKDNQKRAEYDALRQAAATVPDKIAVSASPTTGGQLIRAGACPVCNTIAPSDEGFCPECGLLLAGPVGAAPSVSALPRLLDGSGRELLLRAGESIVGREGADVMLPDKSVSRRHARFIVSVGSSVTLEDLGSTNGTKVAGQPLPAKTTRALSDGDVLVFGSVKVTLQIPLQERKALGAKKEGERIAVAAIAGGGGARLEGTTGAYTLKSVVTTFGRKADNDIVLTGDAFISGSHAKLFFENNAYQLVDLGSTNGTRLNGRKLEANAPVTLTEGDTIQFGQTSFTFRRMK